jgi:hypothetical protein
MILSPEDRMAVLERQMQDLVARVNKLEYASMVKTNQQWPAPTPGVIMGIAQAAAEPAIQPDAFWPFPLGARP